MRTVRQGLLTAIAAMGLAVGALPSTADSAITHARLAWLGTATARADVSAAPAVVLVNQPAATICAGGRFTVGVWYQRLSGGSRAYRIAVYGPRHTRIFDRHGIASSAHWRFWRVLAGRAGKYRTIYSGHRPGSTAWTRYVAVTRARRCALTS